MCFGRVRRGTSLSRCSRGPSRSSSPAPSPRRPAPSRTPSSPPSTSPTTPSAQAARAPPGGRGVLPSPCSRPPEDQSSRARNPGLGVTAASVADPFATPTTPARPNARLQARLQRVEAVVRPRRAAAAHAGGPAHDIVREPLQRAAPADLRRGGGRPSLSLPRSRGGFPPSAA